MAVTGKHHSGNTYASSSTESSPSAQTLSVDINIIRISFERVLFPYLRSGARSQKGEPESGVTLMSAGVRQISLVREKWKRLRHEGGEYVLSFARVRSSFAKGGGGVGSVRVVFGVLLPVALC